MSNGLAVMRNTQLTNAEDLGELFSRWVLFIEGSEKTVETYTRQVRQFVAYLKAHEITEPTKEDIRAYREELKLTRKPATVQGYIMALRQFFKWTEDEGLYPNIAKNVKGAKLDTEHKKDPLTERQVKTFLASIDRSTLAGKRDYAILALMLTTALRTIEVARANVEDLRPAGDNMVLYIQGKGHEERSDYVKITPPVEDAIRDYLASRGKATGKEPLFETTSNNRGEDGRLTTKSISRLVKSHLIDAGLNSDRLTAHSLRHTCITLNLLHGGTLEETRQLARHTNINTTLIYAHAINRANNNSELRVASAIFS